MKIMHVISGDLWAGAEVQVYNTLVALSEYTDFSLQCIVFNEGIFSGKLRNNNISTILIDEKKYSVLGISRQLCEEIKKWHPDIIHVDLVKEHFVSKLAIFISRHKIPLIRTVHGARKSPDHLPFFKSLRSKCVVCVDNWLLTNAADAVIAVSKHLEREFYVKKIKGSIYQIYNAIKTSEYKTHEDINEIRRKYGAESLFWIGTAARLVEPKNLAMLINAGLYLRKMNVPFLISILGDGPLRGDLQSMIDGLALNNYIKLEGFELDIAPVIHSFDAFVLCSIHEGLPMVLLEAMLLKTPIVGTDVLGINEVIEDGINGSLVPLNDNKALAMSLLELYHHKGQREKFIINSQKVLLDKFSLKTLANQLSNAYHDVGIN